MVDRPPGLLSNANLTAALFPLGVLKLVFDGRFGHQAPLDRAENIVQALPEFKTQIVDGRHRLWIFKAGGDHPAALNQLKDR